MRVHDADLTAKERAALGPLEIALWAAAIVEWTIEQARAIVAALPAFVSVVALFVDPQPAHVRSVLAAVPVDVLQFHGGEGADLCRAFGRPYVKAVPVAREAGSSGLLEYAARYSDAAGLLFDAPPADGLPGGTGRTFDWSALPSDVGRPVILSGGLTAANVGEAIRCVRPWGVDVSSGVEALDDRGAPVRGLKDPARIAAFIEEVRHADG